MKFKQNGFSIVEIMVSMVVLSIVMLAMTNIVITSSMQHSAASGKDEGEFVARQKLSELQNPAAIPTAGNDQITYKDRQYTRVWTLTGSAPILAEVTASWTDGGKNRSAKVSGFIEATITEASGIATVAIAHQTPKDRLICEVQGIDANTSAGDFVQFSLKVSDDDEKVYLSGNKIYTNEVFSTASALYTIKIEGRDCRNDPTKQFEQTIKIQVGEQNNKTKPRNPQPALSIAENGAATATVGTLAHDESSLSGLEWILSGTDEASFTLSSDGVLATKAACNFETKASYAIKATLRRGSNLSHDSTVDVSVTVTDANDKPTTVTFTPDKTPLKTTDAGVGAVLGDLTAADQDATGSNIDWKTHNFAFAGGTDDNSFVIDNTTKKLKVKTTALTAKNYSIKIKPTDISGTGLTADNATTISVAIQTPGVDCSSAPFADFNGGSYVANAKLTYKGKRINLSGVGAWFSYAALANSPWVDEGDCAARNCSAITLHNSSSTGYNANDLVKSSDGKIYKNIGWCNGSTALTNTSKWEYNGVCQ